MDEKVTIIDTNTKSEKIKKFFITNKNNLIIGFAVIFFLAIGYLSIIEVKERKKIKIANEFNSIIIDFKLEEKDKIIKELSNIINKKDPTYSPLALYFLIEKKLIKNNDEVNYLFDILINETNLEKEIKNLIIYKKALYNSNILTENDLIKILNPIINSESIWKSHSLYLIAEYFYSNNEKQKSKEFFNQVLLLENGNRDIKIESQKRLNRDFGE